MTTSGLNSTFDKASGTHTATTLIMEDSPFLMQQNNNLYGPHLSISPPIPNSCLTNQELATLTPNIPSVEVAHPLITQSFQQQVKANGKEVHDDYMQGNRETINLKKDIASGKRAVIAEITEDEDTNPTSETTGMEITFNSYPCITPAEISFQASNTIHMAKQQRTVVRPKHHKKRRDNSKVDILFEVPIQIASPQSITNSRKILLDDFDLASSAGAGKLPRRSP